MNNTEMKSIALEYIRKNNGTSYVELERLFEKHGYDYIGNIETVSDKNSNVVFWSGWNRQAFEILADLMKEKQIEREPCKLIVYIIDGKGLNYPVLKRANNINNNHWLPCVFNSL